jgi:hypothetical protein
MLDILELLCNMQDMRTLITVYYAEHGGRGRAPTLDSPLPTARPPAAHFAEQKKFVDMQYITVLYAVHNRTAALCPMAFYCNSSMKKIHFMFSG